MVRTSFPGAVDGGGSGNDSEENVREMERFSVVCRSFLRLGCAELQFGQLRLKLRGYYRQIFAATRRKFVGSRA